MSSPTSRRTWYLWERHTRVIDRALIVTETVAAVCATRELAIAEAARRIDNWSSGEIFPRCEQPGYFVRAGEEMIGFSDAK